MGAAARAGYTDAEVEYGIALFNGTGVPRTSAPRASYFSRPRARAARSARSGWP